MIRAIIIGLQGRLYGQTKDGVCGLVEVTDETGLNLVEKEAYRTPAGEMIAVYAASDTNRFTAIDNSTKETDELYIVERIVLCKMLLSQGGKNASAGLVHKIFTGENFYVTD